MKLIIAIVQDDDSLDVIDSLTEEGYSVTRLATTGGFLKAGNTTLLIGIEKQNMDSVINIIKNVCQTRKGIVSAPTPVTEPGSVYVPYPIEVEVGGATIFVVDVDKFVKV